VSNVVQPGGAFASNTASLKVLLHPGTVLGTLSPARLMVRDVDCSRASASVFATRDEMYSSSCCGWLEDEARGQVMIQFVLRCAHYPKSVRLYSCAIGSGGLGVSSAPIKQRSTGRSGHNSTNVMFLFPCSARLI
jgi:hypothetical protein